MSRDDSEDFEFVDDISENEGGIDDDNDAHDSDAEQDIVLSDQDVDGDFGVSDISAFFEETSKNKTGKDDLEDAFGFLGPDDGNTKNGNPKDMTKTPTQEPKSASMNDLFGKFSFEDDPPMGSRGLSTSSNKTLGAPKPTQQPKSVTSKPEKQETSAAEVFDVPEGLQKPRLPLSEWCRRFRFMKGVEYIKLTRIHPNTYEGINTGGFVQDLDGPVDEEELRRTYGGGSFLLEAIQCDAKNIPRRTDQYYIAISGAPKVYLGKDGKAYPFAHDEDPNYNNPSWREDNMLLGKRKNIGRVSNKLDEELAYSYGSTSTKSTGYTNGPAAVFNSAAELFRMTQNQQPQAKTDDTKTLEILRAAQSDVQNQMAATAKQQQEIYQQMLSAKEAEVERIRREQETLIEKTARPLSEALNTISSRADNEVQALRDQLFRLESEYRERVADFKDAQNNLTLLHQKEKEDIRNGYIRQIELLKNDSNNFFLNFQKEKEELKSQHMTQLEAVKQEFRTREHDLRQQAMTAGSDNLQALKIQMESLRDSHQAQLNNVQKDSQATISNLYQEIAKLREDARERESKAREEALKRESDLKIQHMKEIADIRADYNDRINNVRVESDKREKEVKENAQKAEKELRESSQKSEKELKTTYETRERDLRERFEEKERTNKETLEVKYQTTIDSLREKLEVLKSNSDEKVQQYIKDTERREKHMQAALETNYKAQMSIVEAERDRLRSEVETMRRELDTSRKERKEMTDPISKLKEIQSFKENLQRLGFMPEEDPEDDRIRQIQTELMLLKKKDDDEDEDEDEKKKQEPPKDFLGKIFHYGPSIAENLVVPVLQRFDSATKVANDALETQKLELTNQAKMLEIKSQEIQHDKFRLEKEVEVFKNRQGQIMNQNLAAQAMQNLQFARNPAGDGGLERRRRSLQERRMARESMEQQAPLAGIPQNLARPNQNPNPIPQRPPQNIGIASPTQFQQPIPQQQVRQQPIPQQVIPQQPIPQQVIPQSPTPKVLGANPTTLNRPAPITSMNMDVVTQSNVQALPTNPTATARSVLQGLPTKIPTKVPRASIRKSTRATSSKDGSVVVEEVEMVGILGADAGILDAINNSAEVIDIEGHNVIEHLIENNDTEPNKNLTITEPLNTNMTAATEIQTTNLAQEAIDMTAEIPEGFVKLAEFVQQRMADHDTPEGAATKLKLGVFAGLVPKEAFNEAISTPFEELYRQVKVAAEKNGYSKVVTSKGESFCQHLYDKIKK